MPISEYDGAHGTSSDDVGCLQRDLRTAAPGDPGAAAGGGAASDRVGPGAGDDPAGGVQAPAGAPGGRAGAGPQGRQAAPVRPGRARAATGPRVDRRVRAVLERELRPAGRVRAGPQAGQAGGVAMSTFAPDGAATRIEMRTVFPTKELRDEVVEKYHAIEGGQQTLSNLAAYVTEIVRTGVED